MANSQLQIPEGMRSPHSSPFSSNHSSPIFRSRPCVFHGILITSSERDMYLRELDSFMTRLQRQICHINSMANIEYAERAKMVVYMANLRLHISTVMDAEQKVSDVCDLSDGYSSSQCGQYGPLREQGVWSIVRHFQQSMSGYIPEELTIPIQHWIFTCPDPELRLALHHLEIQIDRQLQLQTL